jgi:hypothetical protein
MKSYWLVWDGDPSGLTFGLDYVTTTEWRIVHGQEPTKARYYFRIPVERMVGFVNFAKDNARLSGSFCEVRERMRGMLVNNGTDDRS